MIDAGAIQAEMQKLAGSLTSVDTHTLEIRGVCRKCQALQEFHLSKLGA